MVSASKRRTARIAQDYASALELASDVSAHPVVRGRRAIAVGAESEPPADLTIEQTNG